MRLEQPKIKCPRCYGKGEIDLPEALWECLFFVANHNGVTPPEIWRFIYPKGNVGVTAINNRLNDLLALGWVRREKAGRAWKYFAAKPKQNL